jgi:glutaminyl-tRNA synthetase
VKKCPTPAAKDSIEALNPDSLKVITAYVEPSLGNTRPDEKFHFERHRYFVADHKDHSATRLASNLAVGLKDSSGK